MEQDYNIDEKAFMELMMQNWKAMHTPKVRKYRKVGRNEICPFCDSGLKYKHCACSVEDEYHSYVKVDEVSPHKYKQLDA